MRSGSSALLRDLLDRRVAVELLGEDPARAEHLPGLLGDVDGQADRPPLVRERPGDRLADPPGRVGRQLEPELPVELLDRADETEISFLDQVQQRDAGLRVVPRDRHHESQVGLDELPLRRLVARVLAARQLPLLLGGQQPAVADRADVELQRVGERRAVLGLPARLLAFNGVRSVEFAGVRDHLEARNRGLLYVRLWNGPRLHEGCIGADHSVEFPLSGEPRLSSTNRRVQQTSQAVGVKFSLCVVLPDTA